ncbi:MAG: 23S rRNA (adenine(2503)-C(2))-methyltransferase RlmN [Desulfurivibrio sp.]|nr:23S rRNA (adenine(2503)-C(2))-methyltransferase RlmN [Desulfurivibrio sp.]
MNNAPTDLKNLTLAELTAWVETLNLKPFRARQLFSWLYRPNFTEFAQMTDIAKDVRALLAAKATFSRLEAAKEEHSADGTVKFAFRLGDGQLIESVLIPEEDRHTLCVSSQVGCAMGCEFCLTGTMGFHRNLTAAEMVGQVDQAARWLWQRGAGGGRLNNLVFMGMGEPLLNFDNLLKAIEILMEQRGHGLSGRRITVSTCGIVPRMKELGEKVPVNLAVSLHAADDATRQQLMPVNRTYPLAELLQACREYPLPPRRRIMIEYALLKGINDSPAAARRLVKQLHGIRCKINILPFNETPAFPYRCPDTATIEAFRQILRRAGHTVLLRSSRGADIAAACGQLAA